ncbi:MAG: MBL fold metallo-hydrolase [Planctomycetota bacterium]
MSPARRALRDPESARITFLGAAREVTGSRFLVETAQSSVMVDFGLLQGGRTAELRNREPLPADFAELDAVVLTHAHIDHSGLLPKLCRDRYQGPIHMTEGTAALCGLLLRDSGYIHEQDAEHENRRRQRRGGKPLEPLYTVKDAEACLGQIEAHPFEEWVSVAPDVSVRFWPAGHILGAASVEMKLPGDRIAVFSGDIGRRKDPIQADPKVPARADLILMESTYGDRNHRNLEETLEEFAAILEEAREARDNVLIPVFAVGRAQQVLYFLGELHRAGRLQPGQIYLDSPLAIEATETYRRHFELLRASVREEIRGDLVPTGDIGVKFCRTPEESMALNNARGAIILAGSGMCEGGRIRHHLKHHLWRKMTHVVIVGFQPRGTLGRRLVDGASQVKLFGESVIVRAKIHTLGGFSAHADQSGLLAWLDKFQGGTPGLALVHGEEDKMDVLEMAIKEHKGWPCWKPRRGDCWIIPKSGPVKIPEQ